MGNIRPFQIILLTGFAILAIVAIYLVKVYNPPADEESLRYGDQVIVWGTLERSLMSDVMNSVTESDKAFEAVKYYQVDERVFDDELVNAIAEGRSPDLVMLRSDDLVKHRAKLQPIPYETISERTYRDNYIDATEIFMLSDGIYALPFAVDPLVMFWNRDLFASNGLAQPPTSWEGLIAETAPALIIRDTNRNVLQSAVAFGEYSNIRNAKAIIMALTMQSGSQLVREDDRNAYEVGVNIGQTSSSRLPLDAAVEFYTDFSNANSPLYTWNRALPEDDNVFVAGELAMYFGLGSESTALASKNPNLNFDIAQIPQGASATIKRTYGDVYGLAIPRGAYNPQGAYAAALTLGRADVADVIARAVGMAPPHRSTINAGDSSPFRQVILTAALTSRSWLDPDPAATDDIFSEMIEDVTSGRARVSSAVSDAVRRLTFEY